MKYLCRLRPCGQALYSPPKTWFGPMIQIFRSPGKELGNGAPSCATLGFSSFGSAPAAPEGAEVASGLSSFGSGEAFEVFGIISTPAVAEAAASAPVVGAVASVEAGASDLGAASLGGGAPVPVVSTDNV